MMEPAGHAMTPAVLLDEPPLVVQRSLVRLLGSHEAAAFVQQVHYLSRSGSEHDGHRWVRMTNKAWCEEVVLSPRQLDRIMAHLVELGILIREQVNVSQYDRTTWTRLDYEALGALVPEAALAPSEAVQSNAPNGGHRDPPKGGVLLLVEEELTNPPTPQGGTSTGRKSRRHRIPDNFSLSKAMGSYAMEQGMPDRATVLAQFETFTLHHQARGSTFVDWPKAWQTWCRNYRASPAGRAVASRVPARTTYV